MIKEPLRCALDAGETILVATPQRAAALRLDQARRHLDQGLRSWRTPSVLSLGAFLQQTAVQLRLHGSPVPRLLTAHEEALLWSEAARQLAAGLQLLLPDALARGLQRAARIVTDHDIDAQRIALDPADESRWLAGAMRHVEQRAAALAAMPRHALVPRLASLPVPAFAGRHWLAGCTPLPAGLERLLQGWRTSAAGFAELPDTEAAVVPQVVSAEDPAAELERAAHWCQAQLRTAPGARLLLVVPDLRERRTQVQRSLAAVLEPSCLLDPGATPRSFAIEGGRPLAGYAEPAAALELLALLTRPLDVVRSAALLQRDFWGRADAAARAGLASRLRETCTDTVTWRDLATLARSDDDLAALAARLEAAASTLNAERGPANLWAERCSRALTQLEWPGPDAAQSTTQQIRAQWTALLRDFAGLSRVLGPVTAPRAVDTLSAMARQQSYAPATGDVAVLVTESLDDPVTRYDGIWVCGLQAERWPMPTRVDPFIPWYLQQQAQVGDATATGCLQRAQRQLEAWRRATPQLVLSHACFDGDAELAASPLLSAWPAEALDAQPVSLAARLRASAPALLELRADPAGLRWNPQLPLPHGTRSLELQNTCAFRAYAELRLGAREPEVRAPGISPKERGILLHAVLQQVWQRLLGQQQLRATTPAALEALLDAAVEVAAQQWLQAGAATVDRRAWQRELQRARAVAQSLLARELERAAFAIHELESARELQVGAARLRLRIDRVDRLEDGRLVLIDYKTGAAATHDWFGPRADPVQLFIYLAALAEATTPVAALGTVHLVRRGRVFVAVGADDGLLPGARQVVDWPGQLQRWHEQVERLAEQFLAGTATLDPVAGACRRCHLAGLCRRSELLEPRDEREPDADEEAELESR